MGISLNLHLIEKHTIDEYEKMDFGSSRYEFDWQWFYFVGPKLRLWREGRHGWRHANF